MKLAQQFLDAGIFQGMPLQGQLREDFERVVNTSTVILPSPNGNELTIAVRGSNFLIYDSIGYLCSTSNVEGLIIVLMLSELPGGARRIIYAEKLAPLAKQEPMPPPANLDQLRARAQALRARGESRIGMVRGEAGSGDELGRTEGYDGPIRQVGLRDGAVDYGRDEG